MRLNSGTFLANDFSSSTLIGCNNNVEFGNGAIVNESDPVILNLKGGPVQTVGVQNSPAFFDMMNDGQKVQTGWGTAGEGYLVYDPANTGSVTDDASLVQGFPELAKLDSNGDGVLNASDSAWSSLKVWVDQTGTGNFQSGQLELLAQLGITSINLNATQESVDNNGNTILADSSFTYANGSTGDIAGANLTFDPNTVQGASGNSSTSQGTSSPSGTGQSASVTPARRRARVALRARARAKRRVRPTRASPPPGLHPPPRPTRSSKASTPRAS